ncbi:hypothetical protein R3P38DRAFT_1540859 [Favolaschia claudopus]|uniref:Uncharacterized protein n=1 Tax=Favolaschia claudopus TaxID=2862362 RepID=A0AAW0AJ54_9AGAR
MSTAQSSTGTGNAGPTAVRLLIDPNLETCPDFSSDEYQDVRKAFPDDATAITALTTGWTKSNDKRKLQWSAQAAEDEAARQEAENLRQEAEARAAEEAQKTADEERAEAEKKKPKLGDFNADNAPPSFVEARISAFAQKKLEKMEYVVLWPFTPTGLQEAASAAISSVEDTSSFRLGTDTNDQLTIHSGPSSATHKSMKPDEDLSWHDFELGHNRFIKEIIRANWSKRHVDALTQFFYLIDTHTLREQKHGEKILITYAARYRLDWHRTLGTDQSFNIARINETMLHKIADEHFYKLRANEADRCEYLAFFDSVLVLTILLLCRIFLLCHNCYLSIHCCYLSIRFCYCYPSIG